MAGAAGGAAEALRGRTCGDEIGTIAGSFILPGVGTAVGASTGGALAGASTGGKLGHTAGKELDKLLEIYRYEKCHQQFEANLDEDI